MGHIPVVGLLGPCHRNSPVCFTPRRARTRAVFSRTALPTLPQAAPLAETRQCWVFTINRLGVKFMASSSEYALQMRDVKPIKHSDEVTPVLAS